MQTNRSKLWEGKNASAGAGAGDGGDSAFNGQREITRNTPGIKDFDPDTQTVIDFLEAVFYPPVAPVCNLTVDDPIREVGYSTDYTLHWSVEKKNNVITGIIVDGHTEVPTGDSQSGTESGTVPFSIGSYTKTMHATDGTLASDANVTIDYLSRMFWGTTTKNGTTDPILDADILALDGSELRADFIKSFTNLGGGDTRLIFAIPTEFGDPQFKVNGFINTAFSKVRASSDFVNALGATISMDVWISDNSYNSPLDTVTLS